MRSGPLLAAAVVALMGAPAVAGGQVLIKVNDDVNFKLGVLGQVQADWLSDPAANSTTQNLFLRRIRLLFGGQVAKNVTFFVETDAPNLGKTLPNGKNISPSVVIQDAFADFKFHEAFTLDAGLMFVPFSRNGIQSAATLLPIDYGAFTFTSSAPTQSSVGRDTGVQARGYFMGERVEYRLGAFQGSRDTGSHRSFRYTGRLQVELLDPEGSGFFYTGTYLGAKKVAAVGGAFDVQSSYHAYGLDAFLDYPLGPGAVTAQADYNHFDGGTTIPTIAKQHDALVEIGYFIRAAKVSPVLQFASRDIVGKTIGDETRTSIGANYWWAKHNANVKVAYGRISPTGAANQNEFTIQLQFFYY